MCDHSLRMPLATRFLHATLVTGAVAAIAPAWGQVESQDAKLLASNGATGDLFGGSVAVDNGVIAVGCRRTDGNGIDSGSVYLFDASTGTQIAQLLPGDGAGGDQFGCAVAMSHGVIVVGAYRCDESGSDSGSAYLFDVSSGDQIFKLHASDGATGDEFGYSVALDNGVVAVGAPGADAHGAGSGSVYLFDAGTGVQYAILLPADGAARDHFGNSVSVSNDLLAVGAWADDDNGDGSGSAYVFDVRSGAQLVKLLASDGAADDYFGHSVAIDDGIVAVGSWYDDDNGSSSGSVYLFTAATGAQIAKLLPSDGMMGDFFGASVAIDSGVVAAGALYDGVGYYSYDTGSAYLFDVVTGAQIAKLIGSDGVAQDRFGRSIAIERDMVVVGADGDDDRGADAGAGYFFDVYCSADLTGNNVLDIQDFISFLFSWLAGATIADWEVDETIDSLDLLAYLNDWAAGCP